VEIFKNRYSRNSVTQKSNLFIKQMPNLEEEELHAMLKKHFEEYGTITSMYTKVDKNFNKPFGFICFETHEQAE